MSKYRLVIFDLDGTILETLYDLYLSTNYVLKKHNMPQRTIDEVRKFVGNGIRRLLEQAVAMGTSKEKIDEILVDFNEYYKEHCMDNTKPYDGIKDIITELRSKGIKTAVVSNKADYGVQSLCKEFFDGMFDYAVGEREGIRRKPYPDSVNHVIERFGASKSEVVYIGDSEVDYKTSKNAGIELIMVTWGFRDEESMRNEGATVFAHDMVELKELLI